LKLLSPHVLSTLKKPATKCNLLPEAAIKLIANPQTSSPSITQTAETTIRGEYYPPRAASTIKLSSDSNSNWRDFFSDPSEFAVVGG
jgi:hypothetical protein